MKIQQAHRIIEDLLTKADRKSEKKLYEQLLGALQNIQARELSSEGVAFGGLIGSLMEGFAGIPDGQSGTGLGIGLGLVAAVIIARHLDVEAIRQNRVLLTRVH